MLADQEGVIAGGPEQGDIGGGMNAAFTDQNGAAGHVWREIERGLERDVEGREIAIVNADEVGAGGDGGVEFGAVMDLDERGEVQASGFFAEIADFALGEDGRYKKDGVGAVGGGFEDLVAVDGEVLADGGEGRGGAGGGEVGEGALEEGAVGEDGEGGGASAGIVGSDAGGVEIGGEDALAGGRLFDFRDDGGGRRAGGEGLSKIAAVREEAGGIRFPAVEWQRGGDGEVLALFGDNSGQDVLERCSSRV